MSDERLLREVGSWLREDDAELPNARQSVRQAMERMPQVRQRSRWWPFPVFYRRTQIPTASDTTEFQPTPISAANGHRPTVIGRTQSMLSPAKAVTVGAILFGIAGAFLIAQPFQQQGSLPGATTEDERAAPVEFTGQWAFGDQRLSETFDLTDPRFTRHQGGAWFHTALDVTDPRFDGEVTIFVNQDDYSVSSGEILYGTIWRVENADGAWQSDPGYTVDFADGSNSGRTAVFLGEDAYEGLVAVVDVELDGEVWDLRGVIFDGDLPPEPEPQPLP